MATSSRRSATPANTQKALTPKQEKFAQGVASGKSQADAYRSAFNVKEKTKPESVQQAASRIMANINVASRVQQLQVKAQEKHLIGVDDIIRELEEARALAQGLERPQVAAMVAATMGKAKVLGLASDKVIHGGDANNPIQHNHTISFGRRK